MLPTRMTNLAGSRGWDYGGVGKGTFFFSEKTFSSLEIALLKTKK